MLITYLRSSSYNDHSLCELKYFISYTLGFETKANKAAQKGSVVHKVLELLASKKLCLQNKEEKFFNSELNKEYSVKNFSLENSIIDAYSYYVKKSKYLDWNRKDFNDCKEWTYKILEYDNGSFNPLNRNIIQPEWFFDIEIKEPWSSYEYKIGDKILKGNLAIRGTIDLTTLISDNPKVIEAIDWKTGKRKCWITDKIKEHDDFHKDFQVRLYHYALSKKFIDVESFIFNVFFVNYGGPYPAFFSKEDLPETLNMIKQKFLTIKETKIPSLLRKNNDMKYKCKWCEYGENNFEICSKMEQEILKIGIDKVTIKYMKENALTNYTGGGRSDVKTSN